MNAKYVKRRILSHIKEKLFFGKAIIIYGARQVGKTTLLKKLADGFPEDTIWFNADNPDDRAILNAINSDKARGMFPPGKMVIIDEAQRLQNAGLSLKIIQDNCEGIQLIATGSSSFELSDKIREAMTGRKFSYQLFPFSLNELAKKESTLQVHRTLENRITYGCYPDIVLHPGHERELLMELTSDYLYKDVFTLKDVRKPETLEKLVQALAYQIGSQVSYRKLSDLIKVDKGTIERYIRLLEEAFIVFRLPSYSRNLRNELKRSRKIYFWDTGVRNAVLNQFTSLELRSDKGHLWENFMIAERMKYIQNENLMRKSYFWRTTRNNEIDYVETYNSEIQAFEIKWTGKDKHKFPVAFRNNYPGAGLGVVDKDNYNEFLNL